ncbi:MAG TPA: DNA recombination protein RmuC, partial [Anaerolineae bacterium]|nr:DNA recombination protein RmuC [Anaerolineae bacterium]
VNYVKQKTVEESGERPDFTFLLPGNRSLNMDVKFPFDNYIRFIEAESDSEREVYRKNFMKDVKNRVKEVTSRAYINPEQNTLNYVLLFIPNEQIYAFIHEQDCSLVDEGLKQRVIICSPITLFAVLAVIRAAVDNFALEQTSNKIVALLGSVKTQLDKFIEGFINLGKKLDAALKEYDVLNTTRRRQLEKPLNEIEHIMKQRGIAADETLEEEWLNVPENSEQNQESL